MTIGHYFVLGLMLAVLPPNYAESKIHPHCVVPNDFNRSYFPKNFVFGTASAAYQYEGHANTDGRGPSTWDTFTHEFPERIADHSNGDIAVDFYDLYEGDIRRVKGMNMDALRFSISWSRVIPSGKVREGINEEGINFYNRLINKLIHKGLEPFVTIFHWDVPQGLEGKYGGFLSPCIIDDFRDFAELCFREFGDRVKYWITLNEPRSLSAEGYDLGTKAPGRCSSYVNRACQAGNSATEPYIVGHHLLLAHASAVQLYRQKYQPFQNGKIGIALNSLWFEPYSNSIADQDAAQRALDFMFGWFMNPITYGDYPKSMQVLVGDRLPKFSCQEYMLVKGSYDFIGLNYYTANYSAQAENIDPYHLSYSTDNHVHSVFEKNGIPIGPSSGSRWLHIVPEGIRYLLNYIKTTYKNPAIYITEIGVSDFQNIPTKEVLQDITRINYFRDHFCNVLRSINEYNVSVKGLFAWSFMDNFEWEAGYTERFGLYYVDFKNDLQRIPKDSVRWFTQFLDRTPPVPPPQNTMENEKESVGNKFQGLLPL